MKLAFGLRDVIVGLEISNMEISGTSSEKLKANQVSHGSRHTGCQQRPPE